MRSRRSTCSSFAVLVAFLLLVGCQPKMVIRHGKSIPLSQAVELDFQDAKKLYDAKRYQAAAQAFGRLTQTYPDSPLAAEAWFWNGESHLALNNAEQALLSYQELFQKHPNNALAPLATYRIGAIYFLRKQLEEAVPFLERVGERFSGMPEELAIRTTLARAYEDLKRPQQALLQLVKLAQLSHAPETLPAQMQGFYIPRAEAARRAIQIIREELPAENVEAYYNEYGGAFPADYLLFRLATIAYETQDLNRAESLLQNFVDKHPYHEDAREARRLLQYIRGHAQVNPMHVGCLIPLSGEYARFGEMVRRGMELAARHFSADQPSSSISVFYLDSSDNEELTMSALETLVNQHHVITVVGPLFGPSSEAAGRLAQVFQVPLVSFSSKAGLVQLGDYVFRNSLTNAAQASTIARYALKNGLKRLAILYPNNAYGQEMMNVFWDEIRAGGGEIVGVESFEPEDQDFKEEIAKLVGLHYLQAREEEVRKLLVAQAPEDPIDYSRLTLRQVPLAPLIDFQGLFVPHHYKAIGQIAPSLAYYDITGIKLLGTNEWHNQDLLRRAKEHLEASVFVSGFFADSARPEIRRFMEDFQKTYQRRPDFLEALAYDTFKILAHLILDEGVKNRRDLAGRLKILDKFPGVTGKTSFNAEGEVGKELLLMTVEGGRFKELPPLN